PPRPRSAWRAPTRRCGDTAARSGRWTARRRNQPSLGPGPWWGEQGDLVAAIGQPIGQQRDHPLDPAIPARRDGVPGRSDHGNTHSIEVIYLDKVTNQPEPLEVR